MKKFFFLFTLAVLALSCEKEYHNPSTIDTAVQANFDNITSSSVVISLTATSDVASYLVTNPAVVESVKYLAMDAVGRLDYIRNNGRESDAPFENTYSSLSPATTYCIGFVAKKADGTICSAPTFSTFTTKE